MVCSGGFSSALVVSFVLGCRVKNVRKEVAEALKSEFNICELKQGGFSPVAHSAINFLFLFEVQTNFPLAIVGVACIDLQFLLTFNPIFCCLLLHQDSKGIFSRWLHRHRLLYQLLQQVSFLDHLSKDSNFLNVVIRFQDIVITLFIIRWSVIDATRPGCRVFLKDFGMVKGGCEKRLCTFTRVWSSHTGMSRGPRSL